MDLVNYSKKNSKFFLSNQSIENHSNGFKSKWKAKKHRNCIKKRQQETDLTSSNENS